MDQIYMRSTHPYAFRSGHWAELLRVDAVRPEDGRPLRMVFVVRFPDMTYDTWAVYDEDALYEFTDEMPAEFRQEKREWLAAGSPA